MKDLSLWLKHVYNNTIGMSKKDKEYMKSHNMKPMVLGFTSFTEKRKQYETLQRNVK